MLLDRLVLLIRIVVYLITWKYLFLKKLERKLVKLQTKAQECVSREKALKILKKAEKVTLKKYHKLEKPIIEGGRTHNPPWHASH